MMLLRRGLPLLALLTLACSDDSSSSDPRDADPAPTSDARVADAAPVEPDASTAPEADAAPAADAQPVDAAPVEPECLDDDACGGALICFDQRCIEGVRCDPGCAAGFLCVGGLCLEDPSAASGLIVDPEILTFLFAAGGDERTRSTRLGNQSTSVVEITGFEIEGSQTFSVGDLALPYSVAPGDNIDLVVNFRADDARNDSAVLHVRANPPEAGVDVELYSQTKTGIDGPCLSIEPARLDFGQVPRGDTSIKHADLVSCGDEPVTVLNIARGQSIFGGLPETFRLEPPPAFPLVLNPADRYRLEVAYEPRLSQMEGGFFEVVSDDIQNPSQQLNVNAFAVPPPLEDVALHVNIEWDTDLTDVDLHLMAPNGDMWTCEGDCYFGNMQPDWFQQGHYLDDPFLDVDDVDGYGPENINIEQPAAGTYRVVIHYYDDHEGDAPNVTVRVLNFGVTAATYGPARMGQVDDVWEVVDIDYPSFTLTPLGTNVSQQPRGGDMCF